MIRIIEPKEYIPESDRDMNDSSQIDLAKYEQSQSQCSSDEDMEVQIVNTEEVANEKVYKWCNRALIMLVIIILVAYFIESLKPLTIQMDGIIYTEVPTIYTTKIGQNVSPIAIFIPGQVESEANQTQINTQLCITQKKKQCWRKLLLNKGFMFIQAQKWLIEHSNQGNILVFWEERLMLSILMLALNVQGHQRIDVIIRQDHPRVDIDNLKINLKKYRVSQRVQLLSSIEIHSYFLSSYDLVVGNHHIFDDIIYPENLELVAWENSQQSISRIITDFVVKTHLMLFYDDPPANLSIANLQKINNLVTSIKVYQPNFQIIEESVKNLQKRFFVIVLDNRMKKASEPQIKQVEQIPQYFIQEADQQQDPIQEHQTMEISQRWQPLKQMHRIQPQKIHIFFLCSQSNRDSVNIGQYYNTKFNNIQLAKQLDEPYLNQTHFYNFVLQLLIANDPCNVMDILQDEMLANILSAAHRGEVFVPTKNHNFIRINDSIKNNKLKIKPIDGQMSSKMIEDFIITKQIKLSFISLHHFIALHHQFIFALNNNMNIVMKLQGSASEKQLLQQLVKNFYVYVVYDGKQKQYDVSCISNFQIQYYEQKQYPEHSFLFISKQDVSFEDINPFDYFVNSENRKFSNKKYPCLQNFRTIAASQTFNLRKGSKTLIINEKISVFVDGDSEIETQISKIKKQQGMTQFIRNSLYVGDKIVIFGEVIQSPYLLASILWKVNGNGEVFFFNSPPVQAAYIQKLLQLNKLQTVYDFMQTGLTQMQLQMIFNFQQVSVIILSPQILAKIYKIVQNMHGIFILLKYAEYSEDLQKMIRYFNKKKQYRISNIESKANIYNLCLSYQALELNANQFTQETLTDSGWIAILT